MGCCTSSSSSRNRPDDKDVLGRRKDVTCTDPICCFLFVSFIIGMVVLTFYAYLEGDIRRVINNHDCFGNVCGKKNNQKLLSGNPNSGIDTSELPYVYYTYSDFWPYSRSLCVRKCPNVRLKTYTEVKEYAIKNKTKLCNYNMPIKMIDSKNHAAGLKKRDYYKSPCAILPVEPQINLLGFCIRLDISKLKFNYHYSKSANIDKIKPIAESIIRDFVVTWKETLLLSVGALGISLLMIFLIRFLAAAMVYLILLFSVLATIGLTVFLWLCYVSQEKILSVKFIDHLRFLIGDVFNTRSFYYMAIVSTVIAVVVFIVIIVMWKRITVVTKLFNEASNCIGKIPSLLLIPVITYVILIGFLFYWFITLGYLMSVAGYELNNRTKCVDYLTATYPKYTWVYFVIGLVWITEFILAGQQMVVAGTVAQWYFLRKDKTVTCAICKSGLRFVFQHGGSVAFGALIITAVRLPRWFLMYVTKKLRSAPGSNAPSPNCLARCCAGCCAGCLYCIEKCLKYINKNAYAVIAIEGTSFCTSAVRAFQLVLTNFLRVAALNSVGDLVLLLGKLCVSFISAGIAVMIFMRREDLYFYPLLVLFTWIVGFFFAHCVLSLYETVLDVLLICYCVEEESDSLPAGDAPDSSLMPRSESHIKLKNNLTSANTTLNRVSGRAQQKQMMKEHEMKL